MNIENKLLNEYGIDSLIPLKGNVCGIKIGEKVVLVLSMLISLSPIWF